MEEKKSIVLDGRLYELTPVEGNYTIQQTIEPEKKTSCIFVPKQYKKAVSFFKELLGLENDQDFIELALCRRLKNLPPLCRLPFDTTDTVQYSFWIPVKLYKEIKARVGNKKGAYGDFVVGAIFGWYDGEEEEEI